MGQSITHAMVIVSCMGDPLHLWGALLREGSFSLNHLQSHWRCHWSYNNLIGGSPIVTVLCFLSWGFTVVLLELDEDLD